MYGHDKIAVHTFFNAVFKKGSFQVLICLNILLKQITELSSLTDRFSDHFTSFFTKKGPDLINSASCNLYYLGEQFRALPAGKGCPFDLSCICDCDCSLYILLSRVRDLIDHFTGCRIVYIHNCTVGCVCGNTVNDHFCHTLFLLIHLIVTCCYTPVSFSAQRPASLPLCQEVRSRLLTDFFPAQVPAAVRDLEKH